MTRRRRGGPRLSAPLAILVGIIVTVFAARLLLALIVAMLAGLAAGAAYAAGTRHARRRPAVILRPRPAPRSKPPAPGDSRHGTGGLAGPPPDPRAALRATLRARADQVSQYVPAAGKPPERPA